MNCLRCGTEFHELDIAVMGPGEEPICDDCELEEYEKEKDIQ